MDISEFTHQVNLLLSCLRDRANNCLGSLHTMTPSKSTMVAALFCQPGSQSTNSRTYTTKLLAIASPNTMASITMPLLNKLEILTRMAQAERRRIWGWSISLWWRMGSRGVLVIRLQSLLRMSKKSKKTPVVELRRL